MTYKTEMTKTQDGGHKNKAACAHGKVEGPHCNLGEANKEWGGVKSELACGGVLEEAKVGAGNWGVYVSSGGRGGGNWQVGWCKNIDSNVEHVLFLSVLRLSCPSNTGPKMAWLSVELPTGPRTACGLCATGAFGGAPGATYRMRAVPLGPSVELPMKPQNV